MNFNDAWKTAPPDALGYVRIRKDIWSEPTCYLRLHIVAGGHGFWGALFSPVTQKLCDLPTPQQIPMLGQTDDPGWSIYSGPLATGDAQGADGGVLR